MSKKIKVLHVYKTSFFDSKGGVQVFINTLANTTSDLGVENTVFSLHNTPTQMPIELNKYKIIQAKQNFFLASTGFSISAFYLFKKLAKQADIIHYHFPNPFADMLHFCCQIHKPSVITYHSDIVKQRYLLRLYSPLMSSFLNSVNRIVATSPNYVKSSQVLKKYTDKVSTIAIGITKNDYPCLNNEKVDYWKARLPQPFFLFVGAMRYYKGLHIALDALKNTNIQFAIAGEGGIQEKLKHQAQKHNLKNVHFLGGVSDEDKIALLHLCYAFVFPSHLRSEAFGISLLEAAFYGKALISCEIGTGTSFVNKHEVTGLVIPPSSPKKLRTAMEYLINNPAKVAEFGENAKQRVQQLFTAEKQANAYLEIYQELIN